MIYTPLLYEEIKNLFLERAPSGEASLIIGRSFAAYRHHHIFKFLIGLYTVLESMHKLIKEDSLSPYNPKPLFGQLCQKWNVYSRLRQQDSHEYLIRLLDGINDELKVNSDSS